MSDDQKRRAIPGWMLRSESWPSLCQHFMPLSGNHRMSNGCWCKPFVQNENEYTVVMHNAYESHPAAAPHWPFESNFAVGVS